MNEEYAQFVSWFRHASPYIHAHRGCTFVISFAGEAVEGEGFVQLMHDIALLSSLGVRLILVHGTRLQIERDLQELGVSTQYAQDLRLTDAKALESVKAACGKISAEIQASLSMGLTNLPLVDAKIRIVSGNFIIAHPVGVRDGVDFMYTGEVRRIDSQAIQRHLDVGDIVLISPLGFSPSGEVFNLAVEDVATAVSISLRAEKWMCLTESPELRDLQGEQVSHLVLGEARQLLETLPQGDMRRQLRNAIKACDNGVQRVHLVSRILDGGLLSELFTRNGIGTMLSKDPFENIRQATIEDVGGIIKLITPLEKKGALVRRSREKLENEIDSFIVQEREGMVVACAAFYPFIEDRIGELACVAVHGEYRGEARGDALLAFIERKALSMGIERLFVLTTHTAHWFMERGFEPAMLEELPLERQQMYNFQRQSKVFIKARLSED